MNVLSKPGRNSVPAGVTLADLRDLRVAPSGDNRSGYAIFDRGGRKISGIRATKSEAMDQLAGWRRVLSRKTRRCMTCSRDFMSEGAHNRMCDRCRATKQDMSGGV